MIFSCILDKMSLFLVGIHIFYLLIRLKKNYVENVLPWNNSKVKTKSIYMVKIPCYTMIPILLSDYKISFSEGTEILVYQVIKGELNAHDSDLQFRTKIYFFFFCFFEKEISMPQCPSADPEGQLMHLYHYDGM